MTNHTGREAMPPCPLCKSDQIQLCTDSNNRAKDLCKCRECGCQALYSAWSRRSDSEGAAPSSKPSEAAVAAPVELPEPDWYVACTKGYRSWDVFTTDPTGHPNYRPETAQPLYTADQMREYGIACRSAPVVQASLTDEEIDKMILAVLAEMRNSRLWKNLTHESGPYDIDVPNHDTTEFVKRIARSLLAAQTKTHHGLPSDLPINQGVRATDRVVPRAVTAKCPACSSRNDATVYPVTTSIVWKCHNKMCGYVWEQSGIPPESIRATDSASQPCACAGQETGAKCVPGCDK